MIFSRLQGNIKSKSVLLAVLVPSVLVKSFLCGTSQPVSFLRTIPLTLSARLGALAVNDGEDSTWLNHGLLLSSFSDGLKPNAEAIDFLMRGLVGAMWKERQGDAESQVAESAVQSPCCGPDMDALTDMESADEAVESLKDRKLQWKDTLDSLTKSQDDNSDTTIELRFLYIPTAMYALRVDSQNTPGKQRQRARVDGKKRRTEIATLVSNQLGPKVSILAATLDLDDASIKQLEGSDDPSRFPTVRKLCPCLCPWDPVSSLAHAIIARQNGKAAFNDWKPHFVYVQGGNTFWLYHCIEKGDWASDIRSACTGDNGAVYCGTSAGAIIMGRSMETACWKGWDDPSVTPDRKAYDQWKGIQGFGLAGDGSFFPHMDDRWQDLVKEKEPAFDKESKIYCLQDEEACCVDGAARNISVLTCATSAFSD